MKNLGMCVSAHKDLSIYDDFEAFWWRSARSKSNAILSQNPKIPLLSYETDSIRSVGKATLFGQVPGISRDSIT